MKTKTYYLMLLLKEASYTSFEDGFLEIKCQDWSLLTPGNLKMLHAQSKGLGPGHLQHNCSDEPLNAVIQMNGKGRLSITEG